MLGFDLIDFGPHMDKVPVTKRAIAQRINRVLQRRNERLKAVLGGAARSRLGDYCVVDLDEKAVIRGNVDLAELARECGVLKDYEEIE